MARQSLTNRLKELAAPPPRRQTKVQIAFRIDPDLLAALKKLAASRRQPYQSLMHQLLAGAVLRAQGGDDAAQG